MTVNVSFPDFSGGEISPKFYGRHDLKAYYNTCRRAENFVIDAIGPASFRTGTVFAAQTKDNNKAFLYTFKYNDLVSYVLEFTNECIRFYRNNGLIFDGANPVEVVTPYQEADLFSLKFAQSGKDLYIAHPSYPPQKLTYTSSTSWALTAHAPIVESFSEYQGITAITRGNPSVLTYAGADTFTNDDEIIITGVSGMTEVNDRRFIAKSVNAAANTLQLYDSETGLVVDSTYYTAYSSGGIIRKIIKTAADFLSVNEYPSAVGFYENRIFYGGSNNKPLTLYASRSNEYDDFTVGTEVTDGVEYTIADASGKIIFLAGTDKFLTIGTNGDLFRATGGIDEVITPISISIKPTNTYGCLDINPARTGNNIYYIQSNAIVTRAYQYVFEQDSYVAKDKNMLSEHMLRTGVTQINVQDARPNMLYAVRNDGVMAGLTLEETEAISGWCRFKTNGVIISSAFQEREGNYNQQWICVKRTIDGVDKYYVEFFSDAPEYKRFEEFVDLDLTEAEILRRYRNCMYESQKEYIHVDSCITYDGSITGSSITPAATTGTDVAFTASVGIFTSADIGRQIWKKSLDGTQTGRAVITSWQYDTVVKCTIIEDFDSTDTIIDGNWYLTTDAFSGADHLEGEEVVVIADGAQHPMVTVTNGAVQLDQQVSVAHIGMKYIGYLETNDLEGGAITGPVQTKKKNLQSIGIRFLDTLYAKFGTKYTNLKSLEFRKPDMLMDRPPVLFTGDKKVDYFKDANDSEDGGWSRSKRIIIVQDQPFPCKIQLLVPYFQVTN